MKGKILIVILTVLSILIVGCSTQIVKEEKQIVDEESVSLRQELMDCIDDENTYWNAYAFETRGRCIRIEKFDNIMPDILHAKESKLYGNFLRCVGSSEIDLRDNEGARIPNIFEGEWYFEGEVQVSVKGRRYSLEIVPNCLWKAGEENFLHDVYNYKDLKDCYSNKINGYTITNEPPVNGEYTIYISEDGC